MPLEGEELDELLSCYLDGQLSDQELRSVQQTLAESPAARARLQELSDVSSHLRDYFGEVSYRADRSQSENDLERETAEPDVSQKAASGTATGQASALGSDFAARVIAEAQRRAVQAGLPDSHHVRLAEQAAIVDLASGHRRQHWQRWQWASAALVAVAASLLLIMLPVMLSNNRESSGPDLAASTDTEPDVASSTDIARSERDSAERDGESLESRADSPRNNPFELADAATIEPTRESTEGADPASPDAALASGPRYVSEIQFGQLEYVMVVNVLLSKTGKQALQGLLNDAGISRDAPIVVGSEVEKTINEARMTVAPRETDSDAVIYLVRADVPQLGRLLDGIYADSEHFPEVAFDLAVDDPQARLLEKIASSTGQRFAVEERFAAPIAVKTGDANGSAFAGWKRPTRLISSEKRSEGAHIVTGGPESNGRVNSVLLIVRSSD